MSEALASSGAYRNQRDVLRQLDESDITPFHWKVMFVSGMGFFTDAYDLFIIGVVVAMLRPIWHLSAFDTSLLSSSSLLASALGAIIFGRVADILGRRAIYGVEVLVLAVGAVASALSPGIWWLIVFRFILGVGVGGDYPVSATIMAEYAGRKQRGFLVSLVFAMQAAGLIIGPLAAAVLLALGVPTDIAWRILLGLGAVPALSVFYLRRQIQETPRFALGTHDRQEFSRAAGNMVGDHTVAAAEQGDTERPRPAWREGLKVFVGDRRLRRWLIGAAGAWFLMDFAYYGNTVSSPLILKTLDPSKALLTDTLLQLLIFAVAAVPGYFVAAATMDRVGRKAIQAGGFLAMAIAFGLIGIIPGVSKLIVPFLVLYGFSYFFTEFGPNTTTFIYPSELFPVFVRTTGNGFAAAMGKLGAFVGVFLFPLMLVAWGLSGAELVAAMVSLLGLVLTLILLPETKARSLEEISEEQLSPVA